jgi:CBS domain containing-hemolysin-like protein
VDDSLPYLAILLLLVLSALFSGSETAFFSINKLQIKKLESNKDATSKRILRLLSKPTYILILILLCNTLINIAVSSFSTILAIELNKSYHWFDNPTSPILIAIQIVLTAIALLTMGEIIPKLFAFGNSEKFAGFASIFLLPLCYILYPVLKPIEMIINLISKKKVISTKESYNITSEDFRNLVKSESADHPLEDNEKEIIAGIFRFSSTEVREIIMPRVDIVAVDESDSIENLKQLIREYGYSRIPVYSDNIDNITGIINVKDLILNNGYSNIKELKRPAFFITENAKIQVLFNHFQANKLQIAIVVDEYGGTAGLVTLEDILEELVGDILDEYDADETKEIDEISEDLFMLSGKLSISEINEKFELDIDSEEFDNLADYLLSEFNHIPSEGEIFYLEN